MICAGDRRPGSRHAAGRARGWIAAACICFSLASGCTDALLTNDSLRPPDGPARVDDHGRIRITLAELGIADAQRFNTQPTLTFPFFTRSDQVLSSAKLTLQFADLIDPAWGVRGLEVLVNQEEMAKLGPDQLRGVRREATIAIDPKVLGDKNQLTLRLTVEHEQACGKIAPESWRLIKSGELILEAAPLPLPDDLAQLPLPFVDRAFDREAQIQLVLPAKPTLDQIRLAGLIAGWLGVDAGTEARFTVSEGVLPGTSAVVLVDGSEAAAALGLAAPQAASIEVMDHPKHPGSNVKLLVIAGRNPEELARAVENLVDGSPGRFKGPRAEFSQTPELRHYGPYESPRWLPAEHDVQLAHVAGPEQLTHTGMIGGKIAVHFRIPPDVFIWPKEFVDLDLGYAVSVPPGMPQPRLDVQMNGVFLGTLAPLDSRLGETSRHANLRVHRSVLHAFNELVVYVNYSEAELLCRGGDLGEFHVQLLGDSTLKVGGFGHFTALPDLGLFAHDGFPFTRLPDLSDTAVVLSDVPRPAEIAMLLSALTHFGTVTGVVGRPELISPGSLLRPEQPPRELMLIGMPESNSLLNRWSDRLPVISEGGLAKVRSPSTVRPLLDLFAGQRGKADLERAAAMVAGASHFCEVSGFESPLWPGRSVVAISGSSEEEWPGFAAFTGYAQSRHEGGDLLLLVSNQRGMFRIGETYGSSQLAPFASLRWFLAAHALLLVPCLFIGVLGLALLLNLALKRQVAFRLGEGDAPPPDDDIASLEAQLQGVK